jgi:iron complex transport system ATP-binding protein
MILEARELDFFYGKRKIIDNCSFRLEPGKLTFITGPNGSGKSTLLHLFGGLLRPAAGSISLDGTPLEKFSHTERACRMGVLTQEKEPALDFTVRERILMGRFARLPRLFDPSREDMEKVEEAMELMQISAFADIPCNHLSGGEYQRVLIAALLAMKTPVMLLDEPTSALDPAGALHAMKVFRERKDSCAAAIVTHDLLLAGAFADELLLFNKGSIFASGTPREVLTGKNIAEIYGCDAEILQGSSGVVTVFK